MQISTHDPCRSNSKLLEELIENGYYIGRIKSRIPSTILTWLAKIYLSFDGYQNSGKSSIETAFNLTSWNNKASKNCLRNKILYLVLKPASIATRMLIIAIVDNVSSAKRVIPQYFESIGAQPAGKRIDAYLNEPTEERIIPWHRDGAHDQDFDISSDCSFCTIKCFIFLPPPKHPESAIANGAGSLSLIPSSHKVVRLVDRLYHEGKINGATTMHSGSLRNWSLEEIQTCANQAVSSGYCDAREIRLINRFLMNLEIKPENKLAPRKFMECNGKFFSFVVFDEKCLHMGMGSATARRLVLRRFYLAKRKTRINSPN